jgi:hypothetical protein
MWRWPTGSCVSSAYRCQLQVRRNRLNRADPRERGRPGCPIPDHRPARVSPRGGCQARRFCRRERCCGCPIHDVQGAPSADTGYAGDGFQADGAGALDRCLQRDFTNDPVIISSMRETRPERPSPPVGNPPSRIRRKLTEPPCIADSAPTSWSGPERARYQDT